MHFPLPTFRRRVALAATTQPFAIRVPVSLRLVVLHVLAVAPTHQRQGLGGLLIGHGLKFADKDKARTYIEATAAGIGLYKRWGWKEVDEVLLDMRPHGGDDIVSTKLMFREPSGRSFSR